MNRLPVLALLLGPAFALPASEIVVYRCVDAEGGVAFQDEPCAGGQTQSEQRYEPPAPRSEPAVEAEPVETVEEPPVPQPAPVEPPQPAPAQPLTLVPPLFSCASFDGDVYVSEDGSGNRRCVPLEITRIGSGTLPGVAQACEWVVDDCRLLPTDAACDGWRTLQRRAVRSEREAFSDSLAEVREDLQRLTAIRDAACSR